MSSYRLTINIEPFSKGQSSFNVTLTRKKKDVALVEVHPEVVQSLIRLNSFLGRERDILLDVLIKNPKRNSRHKGPGEI